MKTHLRIYLIALMGVLCTLCHGGTQAREHSDMRATFQAKYEAWCEWLQENNVPGLGSIVYMDDLYGNKPFQEIVELGCPATPFIVEALQQDPRLRHALYLITKWKYHVERTGSTPEEYTWTVTEFPDMRSEAGLPDSRDVWRRWWQEGRKKTPRRFQALYSEWRTLKSLGHDEKADRKYELLRDLGIAALPITIEQIEKGDAASIGLVAELTSAKLDSKTSPAECLSWWQKNGDKWLIPFPNRRPVAKTGPNQTAVAGRTVRFDGSASVDADGDALSYRWTQVAGPTVELSDAAEADPTFVAPKVQEPTVLTFQLIVDDAGDLSRTVPTPKSKSEPALVRVTVNPKR